MARPKNKIETKQFHRRLHPGIYNECVAYVDSLNESAKSGKIITWMLKKGSILIAKDKCITNTGEASLKVGKQYKVELFSEKSITIIDKLGDLHHFTFTEIDRYFTIKSY